ncbi:transcription antitermination factor NusB [Paeniroseomonas aquatica]|uniref:transcription antitermination factor NusB n=1 Tax=Paeniroseomonas aquatica TaxID=373043 RepID=UPI00338D5F2B
MSGTFKPMGQEGGESELDKLRAEMEAEQRQEAAPAAPKPGPAAPRPKQGGRPQPAAPKPKGRPRTGARVAAVQALYQSDYTGESAEAVIQQFLQHRIGSLPGRGGYEEGWIPEADLPLFGAIVRKAARNGETLDGILTGLLDADWPLGKLDPVLRALLRAATAELWAAEGENQSNAPPAKVVINEYLDIAHGFFGGEEPRFANGMLDALARRLRPKEFPGSGR